jgi:type II secretion system protein G
MAVKGKVFDRHARGTLVVMQFKARGFSLVELMVVISIIGILSAVVYANFGTAGPKARDAERQADLRNLQTAIEKYKQKNGRYPAMGNTGGDELSSEGETNPYIAGLAPEFITILPKDAKRGTNLGYSYVTNTDGTSYKIMAVGTVESETVTSAHPMKSCDTTVDICNNACGIGALQATSYALWGGYAEGVVNDSPAQVKIETAKVICK